MSEEQSPVELLFEIQRDTIRQTEEVIESFVETSTELGDSVADSMETQRDLQEQALEVVRDSTHQSLDAAEQIFETTSSVEGLPSGAENFDEVRDTVDNTFDSLLEQQSEAFDAIDGQHEQLSEETLENLGTQIDLLIEFNERIEGQLVDTAERFVEQAEEADDLTETFEEQLEQLTEQFEEQAERFGNLEEQFEEIEIGDADN